MTALPPSISEYVLHLTMEQQLPAFFVLDQEGRLCEWGGRPERYGISPLNQEPDAELFPFLHGIVPLGDEPVFFPCVETAPNVFADIHVFHREGKNWVLLLDVSADALRQQQMQQRLNEIALQRKPGN
ncbi:MAG: hypothetical protein K1Y36_18025 [Blastocatellia bacterium]|nr:hypothetical protein [Blastocatellia bacterium]